MLKRLLLCALLFLPLSACAKGPHGLPYRAWHLGFAAPNFMEAWVERADVIDNKGRIYPRAGSGLPAIQTPKQFTDKDYATVAKGWGNPGWGAGRYVTGADLPRFIYVRWQSLVEPQTYEVMISIDDATRAAMRVGHKAFCLADDKWITDYYHNLVIGLAPGGIAKVWLVAPCLGEIEVTRQQATVYPDGPFGGRGYHREPKPVVQEFIKKYGVPYGVW